MKITIYSTTTCRYCEMLEKWLKDHNFEYSIYKVDEDQQAYDAMMKTIQDREAIDGRVNGVPYTVIEDDSGTIHTVLGYDVPKFKEILHIA